MNPVYILAGARTPFAVWARGKKGDGSPGGAFKDTDHFDLGAAAVKGALARARISPSQIDRVVYGNAYHAGSHSVYGARYVSLRAGIPEHVPCLTASMACGTGLYALIAAAQEVATGQSELLITGGTDNVSQIPKNVFAPSFKDLSCGQDISKTVSDLALEFGVSRQAQDIWALRSHKLASQARRDGKLAEEIVPVHGVHEDDNILKDPSPEHFQSAKPFHTDGTVTPANTHGVVDGASALLFASDSALKNWGGQPLGRVVTGALSAVAPNRMGYASVPAIKKALEMAKLYIKDIDLFEINETFAAQTLIDIKELDIQEDKVNVNGNAIAMGHPFAGTGGRLVLGLLLELKRRNLKRGAASICIGAGQGVAMVVERL